MGNKSKSNVKKPKISISTKVKSKLTSSSLKTHVTRFAVTEEVVRPDLDDVKCVGVEIANPKHGVGRALGVSDCAGVVHCFPSIGQTPDLTVPKLVEVNRFAVVSWCIPSDFELAAVSRCLVVKFIFGHEPGLGRYRFCSRELFNRATPRSKSNNILSWETELVFRFRFQIFHHEEVVWKIKIS